jgi:surface protein
VVTDGITPSSTINFGTLPSGITQTKVGEVYTLSGFKTSTEWLSIINFTWTMPTNYTSANLLFLKLEILYFDASLNSEQVIDWVYYDDLYYYDAALISNFSQTTTATNIKQLATSMISNFVVEPIVNRGVFLPETTLTSLFSVEAIGDRTAIVNLTAQISVSCDANILKGGISNMVVTSTVNLYDSALDFEIIIGSNSTTSYLYFETSTGCDFEVNWGDGSARSTLASGNNLTHTWPPTPPVGNYRITVRPVDNVAYFKMNTYSLSYYESNGLGNWARITKINSWGNLPAVGTYDWTVNRLQTLTTWQLLLTEVPDRAPSNNGYGMFTKCFNLVGSKMANWYTINGLEGSCEQMFREANNFNININNWNVSQVTSMRRMFEDAITFNQPLNNWDTANVTDMLLMLENTNFNQNINNWNTAKVTNMGAMFAACKEFNYPLNSWNTANVTDMTRMFGNAVAFNQPLNNWNTSKVTRMGYMFDGGGNFPPEQNNFNQDISNWDTSNVTEMNNMFAYSNFNQPLNNWNTANVTTMQEMFRNATAFNQPLNNWNTAKVTDMVNMFNGASVFDQNIRSWDVVLIPSKPTGFDTGTTVNWTTAEKPLWGTLGT